jgi:toxin ParE1/3/4
MMTLSVRLSDDAQNDLFEIGTWLADQAGRDVARGFLTQIEDICYGLGEFPFRGSPRDEIAFGLRSVSYKRRTTIFYITSGDEVVIAHILHGGRDVDTVFGDNTE